jgi:hypothetical protein
MNHGIGDKMKSDELIRKLNSVGKAIFVGYFSTFQSYYNGLMSREDCIELLVSDQVSNENGAAIRCGNAKLIFKAKMEYQALDIITKSKRLNPNVINHAQELMKSC